MSTSSISDIVRRLKEEDGSPPSLAEQQALQIFLDQKTTAEAAARDYTQTVTDSKSPNPEDIWDLLRRVAQGLPHTHESLTHLLKAIKQLPPVTRNGKVLEDNGEQYWSELPGFSFGTREYWDGLSDYVNHHSEPDLHTNFINLTSFNAILFQHSLLPADQALMTFFVALETDHEGHPQVLDTYILAAAPFILQAGSAVHACNKEAIAAGPLLKRSRETSPIERWAFWKDRFALMRDLKDLKESTRKIAKQVVQRMEVIEKENVED